MTDERTDRQTGGVDPLLDLRFAKTTQVTYLTVCILIAFPKHINTIRMGLLIVYLKVSQVGVSKF